MTITLDKLSDDPYASVLTTNAPVDLSDLPPYNREEFLDQFGRAARGIDVVTSELAAKLAGRPVTVHRSDVDFLPKDSISEAVKIANFYADRLHGVPQSPEDQARIDASFAKLSQKTHLPDDVLRQETAGLQTTIRKNVQPIMRAEFQKATGASTPLPDLLAVGIIRDSFHKDLSPTEQAQLDRGLRDYAEANKIKLSPHEISQQFMEGWRQEQSALQSYLYEFANVASANSKGTTLIEPRTVAQIVVPKPTARNLYLISDPPPGPLPITPEQEAYVQFLHEITHERDAGHSPNFKEDQPTEIRGEINVVRALNDTGDAHLKDWYLRTINVAAFSNQVCGYGTDHDAATFIRELEKTGKQIDLTAFEKEKAGLTSKIANRLDVKTANISQIAGATENVLQTEKLTPLQKAEAETYLQDVRALNYPVIPYVLKPVLSAEPQAGFQAPLIEFPSPRKYEPAA